MDIKVENLEKNQVKLTITVDADKQQEFEKRTAEALSKQVKVKGFRPGHAPVEAIKSQVGKDHFEGYLLETNLPFIYADAVKEKGIEPVSRPSVDIKSIDPITIEATVAVKPEITLKDLDKIKIKAPKIEVKKKEIDETLGHITKQHTEFKEVDRKAKKGDKVEIDFEGRDKNDQEIPGAKSENHPIVLGDGLFIPGFEDNLIGLKKDDEHEFEVTFPKDYHEKSLQNAPVKFKVKVKKIEEAHTPVIDDAFAAKLLGDGKTKKDLEDTIKGDLEHQKIHQEEAKQEEELFTTLLKAAKFEVSDILIDEELELLIQDIQRDALYKGQSYEQFKSALEAKEGKTVEEFYRPKAEERVKLKFIIEQVIKDLKIEASDKEIEEAAQIQLQNAPENMKDRMKEMVESENGKMQLKNQIILDKIFEHFIERNDHDCDH